MSLLNVRSWILALAVALTSPAATAKEIDIQLPSGLTASADYRQGQPAKPALLLLHGYLQTRNFPLIYDLANALADDGYSILAPTLSMGIDRREQNLACEALHTHALKDDVEELGLWINWLVDHGHKEIVLIGHSFAAIQFLAYAEGKPAVAVRKLIFISISDMEHKFTGTGRVDKHAALRLAAANPKAVGDFELGFCKRYKSTAQAYLSYVDWTQERVLEALHTARIPGVALFGANDSVVSQQWPAQVQKAGIPVHIIPDGSHFFDDSRAEFELVSRLESILAQR